MSAIAKFFRPRGTRTRRSPGRQGGGRSPVVAAPRRWRPSNPGLRACSLRRAEANCKLSFKPVGCSLYAVGGACHGMPMTYRHAGSAGVTGPCSLPAVAPGRREGLIAGHRGPTACPRRGYALPDCTGRHSRRVVKFCQVDALKCYISNVQCIKKDRYGALLDALL